MTVKTEDTTFIREALKKTIFFVTNITLALTPNKAFSSLLINIFKTVLTSR